jgi:hypothetical protein
MISLTDADMPRDVLGSSLLDYQNRFMNTVSMPNPDFPALFDALLRSNPRILSALEFNFSLPRLGDVKAEEAKSNKTVNHLTMDLILDQPFRTQMQKLVGGFNSYPEVLAVRVNRTVISAHKTRSTTSSSDAQVLSRFNSRSFPIPDDLNLREMFSKEGQLVDPVFRFRLVAVVVQEGDNSNSVLLRMENNWNKVSLNDKTTLQENKTAKTEIYERWVLALYERFPEGINYLRFQSFC